MCFIYVILYPFLLLKFFLLHYFNKSHSKFGLISLEILKITDFVIVQIKNRNALKHINQIHMTEIYSKNMHLHRILEYKQKCNRRNIII